MSGLSACPADEDARARRSLAAVAGRAFDSTESLGNLTADTPEGSEASSYAPPRPRAAVTPTSASGARVPLLPWAAVQSTSGGASVASSEASCGTRRATTGSMQSTSWCDRTPPPSRGVASALRRGSAPTPGAPTPPPPGVASPAPTPRGPAPALAPAPRGDVMVCVRLRPGAQEDTCVFPATECPGAVRLRHPAAGRCEPGETYYQYDVAFGPEATQEQVYEQSVAPICGAVIQGYNGAVIAYGQTGSGKTHTVVGGARCKGVASRAVSAIFGALEQRPGWAVDVSVLEIYNERARDLLAVGPGVSHVEIHEVRGDRQGMSFRCPDATHRPAAGPEDALQALAEGMRRRETARTDMNHSSSRSHLIFTLTVTQSDQEVGATLRGRLHVVDLAGSERLKRSMASEQSPYPRQHSKGPGGGRTPRDQRREAGEINKSLSQLALVIQRLTNPNSSLHMIPYRDSMLTRLLAESFGGSSKTCLIITCSGQLADREETRCSLEFGKRAKLVKNKAEINLEVACDPSPVVQALVAKELEDLQQEKEEMLQARASLLADLAATRERLRGSEASASEAVGELLGTQERHAAEVRSLEEQKGAIQQRWIMAVRDVAETQEASAAELSRLRREQLSLHEHLVAATSELADSERERAAADALHEEADAVLRARIAEQQGALEARGEQVAELREQLSEQEAALRASWQDDVARLEREKLAMAAQCEAQRTQLEERLRRQIGEALGRPADRTRALEEVEARARQAEEEHCASAARQAEQASALQGSLRVAVSDAGHLDEARRERLAALELQAVELRRKWAHRPGVSLAPEPPAAPAPPGPLVAQLDLTAAREAVASAGEGASWASQTAPVSDGLTASALGLEAEPQLAAAKEALVSARERPPQVAPVPDTLQGSASGFEAATQLTAAKEALVSARERASQVVPESLQGPALGIDAAPQGPLSEVNPRRGPVPEAWQGSVLGSARAPLLPAFEAASRSPPQSPPATRLLWSSPPLVKSASASDESTGVENADASSGGP